MIEWKDSLSVDLDLIDDDHRKLFAIMREIYYIFRDKSPKETVGTVLDDLIEYADHHFKNEETLMQTYEYPDAAAHLQAHDQLRKTVLQYREAYEKNGELGIAETLLNFVHTWIVHHIEETDRKLASYVRHMRRTK